MIKRIESKENKEKKERRNQFILGGILVVVLLFSVFGIAFQYLAGTGSTGSSTQTVTYKGLTFQLSSSGYYVLQSGSSAFYFSTNPINASNTTENVIINKTLTDYAGKVLYVSSPYDYNSYNELYTDLSNYTIRVQGACAENETCLDKTLPLKNCTENLIVIKESSFPQIYQKDNCVYIEGNQSQLLSLTDEFLLHILGIN